MVTLWDNGTPPEAVAGIAPYATHQVARAIYYLSSVPWSLFGWTGSPTPPQPIPFVDLYSAMALPGGLPAAQAVPTAPATWSPCYIDPSRTEDLVHLTHQAYLDAYAALS